ncbi:MoxR family ATPase [Aeromicrobium camelliae]|uniref:MoxR family ATPase n=1 Tax=Aeromicrobium camelliae TaxID=1538144 RepID=A0A3N6WRS2_9ACTN|nr:MoxR family ATPase [Aeromicrobium camelliae]RQN10146.1 MoxR family ATPase [Aeromicrobium camelliae]
MDLAAAARALHDNVSRVIDGKPDAIDTAIVVLLAEGHLLIEDVPGVGKTALARALARSVDGSVNRVQFTPDLLPSDITGVSVFDQATARFEFRPGAVFAHVVIGDEINRASPKTQSALLEAMSERQVSVDGTTYQLSRPFMVVATQNPLEMEGTYALPEAQRDRFMARISMGYPDAAAELDMIHGHDRTEPIDALEPVVSLEDFAAMIAEARAVHVSDAVGRYVVDIATATRSDERLLLGASPRATLQLVRAAKAYAAVRGREFVVPDDIDALAVSVLAHRLIVQRGEPEAEHIVRSIVDRTPVPTGS